MNDHELKEFYNKGILAFEKQNYDYAIEIFSQILSSKYDHLEARHFLHLSLQRSIGTMPPSIITNIINYINSFLLSMKAEGLLKKGDTEAGLETFEKIISSNPSDISILKKIAGVFYKANLINHAISNLEEAKSINPKDIDTLKKLGELYLKKEDYLNAKSNYESALKINPNDPDARHSLKNLDALGTIKREFST